MAFWSRLRTALGRPQKIEAPKPVPAASGLPSDELLLRQTLERLAAPGGEGREAARAALRAAPFREALERLWSAGRERTVIEILRRALTLAQGEHVLAMLLAERLCDRLEFAEARPFLEDLLASPEHALRARFLLAEAAERTGDLDGARLHYELVLAEDIDYPKARGRYAKLRPERAVAAAAPTVAGVEGEQARVGDRYRLRRELGRGHSGAVYVALDEELGREVALKLLHASASARLEAARLRAWNEARIAAALRHPGVVAVYDLDEERGLIAMELCAGGTLRERLTRGRLSPAEAVRRAAELYGTLEAVHRAGVLHRDLKPGNLLLREAAPLPGETETLVLGDFGLAAFEHTAETVGAGTLPYLAPEARRGELSPASDVYAGGVILHELLTGALPFDRTAILRGEPRRSGELPGGLPDMLRAALTAPQADALTTLLSRLLDPMPAARPTPAEARDTLLALLR